MSELAKGCRPADAAAPPIGDIPGPAPLRLSGRLRVWKELHDQALRELQLLTIGTDGADLERRELRADDLDRIHHLLWKARQVFDYAIHTLAKEGQ